MFYVYIITAWLMNAESKYRKWIICEENPINDSFLSPVFSLETFI